MKKYLFSVLLITGSLSYVQAQTPLHVTTNVPIGKALYAGSTVSSANGQYVLAVEGTGLTIYDAVNGSYMASAKTKRWQSATFPAPTPTQPKNCGPVTSFVVSDDATGAIFFNNKDQYIFYPFGKDKHCKSLKLTDYGVLIMTDATGKEIALSTPLSTGATRVGQPKHVTTAGKFSIFKSYNPQHILDPENSKYKVTAWIETDPGTKEHWLYFSSNVPMLRGVLSYPTKKTDGGLEYHTCGTTFFGPPSVTTFQFNLDAPNVQAATFEIDLALYTDTELAWSIVVAISATK